MDSNERDPICFSINSFAQDHKIATTLNRAYLATARSPSPKFPFGTSDTLQPLSETFLFYFEIDLDLSLNRTPEHNLFVVAWVMIGLLMIVLFLGLI